MAKRRTVFVAIEFGGIHDQIYELAIRPAIDAAGYESYRDSIAGINRDVYDQIIRPMQMADLGVFDISTKNPNVFWELGYSRCLSLPSFVTTYGKFAEVPFDIRSSTIISYSPVADGIQRLKDDLTNRLKNWRETLSESQDGLHVRCHGTKFEVPGAADFWRRLHEEATNRIVLLGRTNGSWLEKDEVQTVEFARSITRVASQPRGEVSIISANEKEVIDNHFRFFSERFTDLPKAARTRVKYFVSQRANYGAHVTDRRLVLLPYAHTEKFRNLSLVLEILNSNCKPYQEYLADLNRYCRDHCHQLDIWES